MRNATVRPLGGWVNRGSERGIPIDSFRRLDNAETAEDVVRWRKGRARLNHTAPKRACLEGRAGSSGYGLVKAHSSLNPGASTFTVECTVRLPKITQPSVASVYGLISRASTTRFIEGIELFSSGSAVQIRAKFTVLDTALHTATSKTLTYNVGTRVEGTLINAALRRGGTAGGTPGLIELVIDGVVQSSYTLGANEVFYGTDAAETELTNFPGSYADMVAGERDLLDVFVLNQNPDFGLGFTTILQGDPRLAEVRFWSSARTDALLLAWSRTELDSTQAGLAGLVAYYPLKAGSGRFEANGKSGSAVGSCYLLPNPPSWATASALEFLGRDSVVRFPYVAAYDRVAASDAGKAVRTWTYMWRFTTGNYLQNFVTNGDTNGNRRLVLMQWGNDPALPQIRASILKSGADFKFVVESTHNGTVSTLTSSTNLSTATTYTFWVDRNGTALRMFLNDGSATVATATITAANNGFGTGTTSEIFLGAGVSSAANALAYLHEKFFYGTLQEVRLYARVLEQDVRQATYAADLARNEIENDADLILCAQFQEGIGRTITESSKSANVGILTRDFYHALAIQWNGKRPPVWRAGFMTPQVAPPFNALGSYVKKGGSIETIVGVAGGIAYEVAQTLTEQVGTVALDEVISETRPFSAVALGHRLYLADGRNPVVAVQDGVVRPCGIADLPASAYPVVVSGGPGNLLGYYAYAVQLKSAFTGALSRVVKTAGVRFRNERSIVGYGLSRPTTSYYNFDGVNNGITFPSFQGSGPSGEWTTEVMFRAENVLTERGESRAIRLDGVNDSIRSASDDSGTALLVNQPSKNFTYEIRFQWVTQATARYILIHCQNTAAGAAGVGTIALRTNAVTASTLEILNGTSGTPLFSVTGLANGTFYTFTVVLRDGTWELYQNGVHLNSSGTAPATVTAAERIRIGQDAAATAGSHAAIEIGEFRLWDYARASSDILAKYRSEITATADLAHLLVYWKMNEETGSITVSSTSVVNAPRGAVFDGSPLHQGTDHRNNRTAQTVLLHDNNSSFAPGSLGIWITDIDSAIEFGYRANSSGNPVIVMHRQVSCTQNKWYHVAVTNDGANNILIYIDGLLVATIAASAPQTTIATAVIGKGAGTFFQPFKGDIDEVRAWSSVRTLAQIQANAGNEIERSPIAFESYYRLNGNALDSWGTDNGTVSGATATTIAGGMIPTGMGDFVTARRLYRSAGQIPASESAADTALAKTAAEAGPFYLISEIDDNSTTQFSDNTPDTSLVTRLDEDHAGDPPYGSVLTTFGNQLVVAAPPDAKTSWFASDKDGAENFDIVGDSDVVEDSHSGAITAALDVTRVAKQAVLFTETGVYSIQDNGSRIETASLATGVGCVSRLGAVRVDDDVYFWDRKGPMVLTGGVTPIYHRIEGAVRDDINQAQVSQVIAVHHYLRRQVHFLVVEGTNSTIGAVYKYHYARLAQSPLMAPTPGKWIRDAGSLRAACAASISIPGIASIPAGAFYADSNGYVLVHDRGNIEGGPLSNAPFDSGVYSVTGVSGAQISVTPATLPTTGDGLKGVSIRIVNVAGEADYTVASNTSSTITITGAFSPTPLNGDAVLLGPIAFKAESGWWDGSDEEQGPAVTRKMWDWFVVHFDNEGLSSATTVNVDVAVRERGYYGSLAYDQNRLITLTAAQDTAGVVLQNQPVQRMWVTNGLGRFFRYRISGTRPSGAGFHQVEMGYRALVGAPA